MLIKLAFLLFLGISQAPGANARHPAADSVTAVPLSPAEIRSALLFHDVSAHSSRSSDPKNVALAFGLSAVLPGAGQIYNGQWVKAAAAIALEAALAAGYIIWHSKGLDAEEQYQTYAHAYWDAGRYANWLNDYVIFLEQEHGATIDAGTISSPDNIDFSSPGSWTVQERQSVRAFFDQIRNVEGMVFHPETGASFSHKLPYFAEQQYYELIGKYFQFAPGWVDYPAWKELDGEFTGAIDPELTGPGGTKPNVQGRFRDYARDHADANTLLRRASRVSALIVLNHVVAAVDAAITTKLRNDRLAANVEMSYGILNEPQLFASLSWRF